MGSDVVLVTDGFYHSVNPSFDPKGELLYFLSYRSFTTRVDVFEDNHVELYNLKDDLSEKNDLAAKLPDQAKQLRAKLARSLLRKSGIGR